MHQEATGFHFGIQETPVTATFFAIACCTAATFLLVSLTTASRTYPGTVAARPSLCEVPGESSWSVGLTKSQAEDLLDYLEANGRRGKLTFVSGQGFSVC